ncbi:hypothetical protein [Arcticibacter tournemirensis]
MKRSFPLLFLFVLLHHTCFSQEVKPQIAPYVNFLNQQNTSAKDYILGLFKKYDVVILCEREHPEITQYDLIYDVVSSPYFQKNVGTIFTEVGSYSNRKNTLGFTKTKFTNDSLKQLRQAEVYRNGFFPMWNNTNFYNFTGKLNSLNNRLRKNGQINLLTCGSKNPTSGERKSLEGMKKYVRENFVGRDSLMASYIIQSYDSICKNSTRKKALVIMNYRHAFSKNLLSGGSNVGTFIFDRYPGKVANVYINHVAYTDKADERQKDKPKVFQGSQQVPIQDGKWDASFKIAGKENIGFDFTDSPFGKEHLDIWADTTANYRYQDIFTGFVFYLPLEKHKISFGVKNFFYGVNFEEMVNEWNLFYKALGKNEEKKYSPEFQDAVTKEASTIRVMEYSDLKKYEEIINKWL